jgi:hypothetical protein
MASSVQQNMNTNHSNKANLLMEYVLCQPALMLMLGFLGLVTLYNFAVLTLGFIHIITNSMHCLSLVYWIITPLHVSGISTAHHQEVKCIYVANGNCYTCKLTVSRPTDSQLRSITSTIFHIYTGGAKKLYTHFKKGTNCIKIVMVLRSMFPPFSLTVLPVTWWR